MRIRFCFLALFFTACAAAPPPAPAAVCPTVPAAPPRAAASPLPTAPPTVLSLDDVKARVVARYNANDAAGLVELFGPRMKVAVPLDKVTLIVAALLGDMGQVTASKLVDTSGSSSGVYALTGEHGSRNLALSIDDEGKIVGLTFKRPGAPPPPLAASDISLALPFHGKWTVHSGGDRRAINHHVDVPAQRRAADIAIDGEDGKSFRGEGTKNEDYLVFGKDILAVADGTVVMVVDGVPENIPHEESEVYAGGNSVTIRHTATLYSFYAHLQPGSARLKVGAKVKQGDVIGRCGNTGRSSEPHLHFQLQDGPSPDASWGVEPHFHDVTVLRAGKTEKFVDYTLLQGDVVEASPSKAPLVKAPPAKP